MKNKGFVIFLTVIITLLCVYYLSFTQVSRGIQKEAVAHATKDNVLDVYKKQKYLDSIWNKPVLDIFGLEYTYKEIKQTELNLGLDLQGGMHVTLEVSPVDIIKGLSSQKKDPEMVAALKKAQIEQRKSQEEFVDLFYKAYQEEAPGKTLASLFFSSVNKDNISLKDDDAKVLAYIKKEVEDAIDRSEIIIRTRVDQFGTSQPNIQRIENSGRIQVEIPGADNPQRIRDLLQGVAKLEFFQVVETNELGAEIQSINTLLVNERKAKEQLGAQGTESAGEDELANLGVSSEGEAEEAPVDSLTEATKKAEALADSISSLESDLYALMKKDLGFYYSAKDTAKINNIFRNQKVINTLPRDVHIAWDAKPIKQEDYKVSYENEDIYALYFLREGRGGKAGIEGDVISSAYSTLDDKQRFAVSMTMNPKGTKEWRKMTTESRGKRIAVVLDGRVFSAPGVSEPIENGRSIITGTFTQTETQDLANILKAGALPAPTRIVEEAIIGPTLGKEAQKQGITSILAGLCVVIVFMIFYYAKGGIVANVALLFNILFILGILAQRNAALTLPGIAGIVLTIGMSIDANVLIFERIREELRNGSGKLQAISTGYKKAFWTIFDSNFTTLLTAVILANFGLGPVRGFAITLIIGIFCSFFSAIYITRVIVEAMTKKGEDSKISFKTPFSAGLLANLNFDFMSKRKIAYMVSGGVITAGMIILWSTGLNLGVDFKGGRSYVVAFDQTMVASDVKQDLSTAFEGKGTEVKTYGSDKVLKVTTAYLDEDESDEADAKVRQALISGFETSTGLSFIEDDAKVDASHFSIASSSKVGATIADDIKDSSYKAGAIALIAIFLYILIRFRKWQFSTGAIIALVHDSLFVFSAFAIAGLLGISFEIDQVFVAALLTIVGYSINDTVVVFDRIRENLAQGTSTDRVGIFNGAINMTLNRTLITSVTTLIVVLILLIFGGAALRGFSFALFIGVLVGTYSSIFIASPTVIDLSSKSKSK